MPIAQSSSPSAAGQVTLTAQPPSTQSNLRQMIGEVLQWNPDAPVQLVKRWLQNSYRKVVDERLWYGLMVKGQISIPDIYTTGTVAVTQGSDQVVGTGTVWDNGKVGQTFRVGFTNGIFRVKSVEDATHLTLDLKWGASTQTNLGYSMFQNIVTLGSNIKMVLECMNQRQGYRLGVNMPQAVLNQYDVWRAQIGYTFVLASYPPSATGEPQYELYPAPTSAQVFPYIAYVQPPDLANDADYPYTFIRSDIVVLDAIAEALLFRGKNSKYFDPQIAGMKKAEFVKELEKLQKNDDNHYMKDLRWEYGKHPFSQHGADWSQSHEGEL